MDQQDGASGVATAAKDQAGQVGQTAADAGGQVAQTTKEQAQNVVGEAKQQARDLFGEARGQVRDQAGTQKGRAVDGLRSLADELDQMAQQGGQSGIATEVARQAAQRAHGLADHLDRHEPSALLDQARAYARRRPVAFLTGAAVLGVLAGRLTRNLASNDDSGQRQLTGAPTTPQLSASGSYPGEYGTVAPATYPVGTEPGYGAPGAVSPGYPGGGSEATPLGEPAAGYEPQPGGGFRQPGFEPGYESGQTGYESGYAGGNAYPVGPEDEPGAQPASGYEGGAEDPAWRTP
jgi:hypothetical protein